MSLLFTCHWMASCHWWEVPWALQKCHSTFKIIGVRDEFCSRGLKSGARIFFPLLARKSSGFARILPDVLPENGYLNNSRGLLPPSAPWALRLCSKLRHKLILKRFDEALWQKLMLYLHLWNISGSNSHLLLSKNWLIFDKFDRIDIYVQFINFVSVHSKRARK